MNLTTKQFAEVLSGLSASQAEREKENRRAPRVLHRCRVPVWIGSDLDACLPTIVTVRDISSRGICLLHSKPMEVKANFIIELAGESGPSVHILCTVARCRAESKSLYTIGAAFTSVIREAQQPAPSAPKAATASPANAAAAAAAQAADLASAQAADVERIRRSMFA